jgi:type I restriction-modification system DNA methylase subunit
MASIIPEGVKTILEPTAGIGNLVAAVMERLPGVAITAPENFFLLDKKARYDLVIANPPFTSKSADITNAPPDAIKMGMRLGYYILTELMKMSDEIIILMPWFTISDSDIRLKEILKYGLVSITPLPRKTFRYARIQTMVMHLKKGYKGPRIFNPIFHEEII